MFKALLIATSVLVSVNASAKTTIVDFVQSVNKTILAEGDVNGFNWKVGDQANYAINMGGFIKGTMDYSVKAINGSEATLGQEIDLGFAGKQSCETVIDTANGQVKSIVCNGQNQNPGDQGEIEVVDTKEDNVTVPAGKFNCLYVKAHDKKQNADIEQWINPKLVPIMGLIKAIMPSQMGKVNIELTSFKKM